MAKKLQVPSLSLEVAVMLTQYHTSVYSFQPARCFAMRAVKNHPQESFPQMPPEIWCSPSAILNIDWTVIKRALNKTTPPIENAM
jgi:hypothetical protein